MLTTSFTVPYMALTLPVGVLADKVDRRKLLLVSQLVMAAVALALAVPTALHRITPVGLLVASSGLAIGSVLGAPPWETLVPELVPRAQTAEAVTLNSIAFNIARASGPALGGLVLGASGPAATFVLNGLSYLAVTWVLWRYPAIKEASELPREIPEEARGASLRESFVAPLRFVARSSRLRAVFLALALFCIPTASIMSILPAFAKHELHASATGYGAILCAMGSGAITFGVFSKRIRRAIGPRVLVPSLVVLYSVAMLGISRAHSATTAALLYFPVGVAWLGTFSTLKAICQLLSPSWIKSRVSATYQLVFMFVWTMGAAAGGNLAEHTSERTTVLAGALGTLVAAFFIARQKLPASEAEVSETQTPAPTPVAAE
jgi:predicted MFS family arabinose efflux permease